MQVQPYLFFSGRCEEALAFYRSAIGAEVSMLVRYKNLPDPAPGMIPPGFDDKVMHAQCRIGDSTVLVSDGHPGQPEFKGFALSVTVANPAEAEAAFNALADGGEVRMPLAKTFFSPSFGMLVDRFGVNWMVYVAA